MNKKRVAIFFVALFILIAFLIFGITGIFNVINNNTDKTKNHANINTSQIKEGTNYNHNDSTSEYDKMLAKQATEAQDAQNERAKEEKEKKKKKEEEKKEKYAYDVTTENGKEYLLDDMGGKLPKGAIGTKPITSKKSSVDINKDIKPIYSKYEQKTDNTIANKKTKETIILQKLFDDKKYIQIVNSSVSTKGNSNAIAYQKDKDGKIKDTLISISNLSGTAKQEHVSNLDYIVTFNEIFISNNLSKSFNLVKRLGLKIDEQEFEGLYKKYKDGKLTESNYKKPYSIGYDGMGVTVEW